MYAYYPGRTFPSISVTGNYCELRCEHCYGKYLSHMIHIRTPEELIDFVIKNRNKINGFLLSGGSLKNGKVPLADYAVAVRWIKENTDLLVNIHTGLIDDEDIEYLKEMSPDHISFDVVGADETVSEIFHLDKGVSDYFKALELLDRSGLVYSPHIIIGLHFGKIIGERKAIKFISKLKNFSSLVLLVLIPTRGTPMENVSIRVEEVEDIMKYAASKISPNKIILGCMRPRNLIDIEQFAVDLGFRGVVLPSPKTVQHAKNKGIEVVVKNTCCVF